jgi:hypothetical protein
MARLKITSDDYERVDELRQTRTKTTARVLIIPEAEVFRIETLIRKLQQIQNEIGNGEVYIHDEDDRGLTFHVSTFKTVKLSADELKEIKQRRDISESIRKKNEDLLAAVRARSRATSILLTQVEGV